MEKIEKGKIGEEKFLILPGIKNKWWIENWLYLVLELRVDQKSHTDG